MWVFLLCSVFVCRAGTVFWDYLDGSRMEPAGVRDKTNIFTDSNYAAYGMTYLIELKHILEKLLLQYKFIYC